MDKCNPELQDEMCPYDPRVGGSPKNCPWIEFTTAFDAIQAKAVSDPNDTFCPTTAKEVLNTSQSLTYIALDVIKSVLEDLPFR